MADWIFQNPGIYYAATIVSETYEHPVQPSDPARPFRGFQGSNVPVPPDVAAALAARAAARLEPLS